MRENNLKSKLSYTKVEADVIISLIKEVIKVEAVIQKLVIEFREKQHTEADIFIDKNIRTVEWVWGISERCTIKGEGRCYQSRESKR